MRVDPKVRKNGRCAQCGGDRTPKKGLSGETGTFARVFAAAVAADPFCSAACARAWHDVPGPPKGLAVGTPRKAPSAAPPTRLQLERGQLNEERRRQIRDGVIKDLVCDWCGQALPEAYIGMRRFCSTEHRRKWHGHYKKSESGVAV